MADSEYPNPGSHEASVAWRAANSIRGRITSLAELITSLRQEGSLPTWRTVARLGGLGRWEYLPSEPVVELLAALIGTNPDARLLDPWAGAAVLLSGLVETNAAGSLQGIIKQPDLKSVAEILVPEGVWRIGDPLIELAAMQAQQTQFDLVACCPPWGVRIDGSTASSEPDKHIARLTLEHQLVLASCQLLTDEGRAFFVLPNTFLLNSPTGVRALLAEHGLHIWSVIALPPSWNPNSSIAGNVIEIRRRPTAELFVAKVSPGAPTSALLANFSERRRGKAPEVGSLVAPEHFSTWETFENGLAFEAAVKSFGDSVSELSSFVIDKILGNRTGDGGFEDRPNAVFIPTLGTSPAVTSRSELSIKPQNYIQLVLNPSLADAEYVAKYFNTSLGALTRRMVYTGTTIRRASLKTIERAPIVLPPLADQVRIVGLQRRLDELQAELKATERDLWRSKNGARSADRVLQAFPASDGLDLWLPRLPFPLASILWNYQATLDARRKTEILFAFFEATAEFVTTILLSGLRSDPSIYEELKRGPLSELEGARWREATLGFWVITSMNLAKTIRGMLSGDQRLLCRDLFRCSDNWLDAMAGKELFVVLQRVNELRNSWKAHGGIESDRENQQRLDRLQSELTFLFTPLTLAFEDLTLIRPKTMQYDGQLYEVVAEELVGPAVPFRETTRQVVGPMRTNALFLIERNGRDGLELLPFIQMRAGTPAATACYFYSRLGREGARFVSYHQAQDSELVEENSDLTALVNDLTGLTS